MEYTEIAEMLSGSFRISDFDELVARGKSFDEIEEILATITRFEEPDNFGNFLLRDNPTSKYIGGM